jgi:hypothetical protein
MEMLRPIASELRYPYIRAAPGFQLVMIPSRVLVMMASSEESTMAASSRRPALACPAASCRTRWRRATSTLTPVTVTTPSR